MYDLKLADGTILGECCHGSSRHRAEMVRADVDFDGATPYKMGPADVCDWCGWGPANADRGFYGEW